MKPKAEIMKAMRVKRVASGMVRLTDIWVPRKMAAAIREEIARLVRAKG